MLSAQIDEIERQSDLFQSTDQLGLDNERTYRLMAVMDEINRTSRAKTLIARDTGTAAYTMRREHLSPAYTTYWQTCQAFSESAFGEIDPSWIQRSGYGVLSLKIISNSLISLHRGRAA